MGAKEKGLKTDPETEGQESGSKRGEAEETESWRAER